MKRDSHDRDGNWSSSTLSSSGIEENGADMKDVVQQCEELLRSGNASPKELSRAALALEMWHDTMANEDDL